MGYYITLEESDFVVPETPEVYNVLCALNHDPSLPKNGGSWSGGKQTDSWFSWMPANYDETTNTAGEVFELLGFEITYNEDRTAFSLDYYDRKVGQENLFVAAVAPFVEEKSFLSWRGEEGERWREEVRDGSIYTMNGVTVWQ